MTHHASDIIDLRSSRSRLRTIRLLRSVLVTMGGFSGGVGTDEQEDTGGISTLTATATESAQLFSVFDPTRGEELSTILTTSLTMFSQS